MDVITRWQKFPTGLILCDCPYEHIPLFTDILLHSSSLGKHTTCIFITKYFSIFLLNMFDCMLSHAYTNIQNSHRMKYIYICTVSQRFPISLYSEKHKAHLRSVNDSSETHTVVFAELVARRGCERNSSLILSLSIVNLSLFALGKHKIESEVRWYSMSETTKGKIR